MSEIVLVHGIANEQRSADSLEGEWIPELAGGVRTAGHPELADRLWRVGQGPGTIETRMAFYGNLFLVPGQQGGAPLTQDEYDLAVEIALDWLQHVAERSSEPRDRGAAEAEVAAQRGQLTNTQGLGAVAGSVIRTAAGIRWFAPFGMGFAQQFVRRSLRQVTRYLKDDDVRDQAIASVLDLVDERTRVIVGHSLGSVVAYEAALELDQPLPLLLTLGSPLGLENIVYRKLRRQPPPFPPQVRRWVNVADRDDFIAAVPDLAPLFTAGMPDGASFDVPQLVDNGAKPHTAAFYLTKAVVGQALAEALS
jgi:alpha/beta hydrolase family protein